MYSKRAPYAHTKKKKQANSGIGEKKQKLICKIHA